MVAVGASRSVPRSSLTLPATSIHHSDTGIVSNLLSFPAIWFQHRSRQRPRETCSVAAYPFVSFFLCLTCIEPRARQLALITLSPRHMRANPDVPTYLFAQIGSQRACQPQTPKTADCPSTERQQHLAEASSPQAELELRFRWILYTQGQVPW